MILFSMLFIFSSLSSRATAARHVFLFPFYIGHIHQLVSVNLMYYEHMFKNQLTDISPCVATGT
jgi:hypothetical protein